MFDHDEDEFHDEEMSYTNGNKIKSKSLKSYQPRTFFTLEYWKTHWSSLLGYAIAIVFAIIAIVLAFVLLHFFDVLTVSFHCRILLCLSLLGLISSLNATSIPPKPKNV